MKIISIITTAALFFIVGHLILAEGADNTWPTAAALWGAVGTAALVYWPHRTALQLISLCWLCIVLYAMAGMSLAECTEPRIYEDRLPSGLSVLILLCIPFLMVLLPIGAFFVRSAHRDHMRTVLEEAVLAATDPLHGPEPGAMEKACHLLSRGTPVDYIPEAMVARDELFFEAVETPNTQAEANAVELIPLLARAGASISNESLHTASYTCPPAIQAELQKLPRTSS